MNAEVVDRLRDFIATNFLFGDVGHMPADTDSLLANGVLDSTGVLELIEFLEAEFAITVEETETVPQNLDSIAGLARYVSSKRAEGAA